MSYSKLTQELVLADTSKKLADIDLGIESLNKDSLVRLFENTVNSI